MGGFPTRMDETMAGSGVWASHLSEQKRLAKVGHPGSFPLSSQPVDSIHVQMRRGSSLIHVDGHGGWLRLFTTNFFVEARLD